MSTEDQQIIVVNRSPLFRNGDYFHGFRKHGVVDYESRILQHFKIMRRGDAEKDPSHKQPISYTLIISQKTKQVFAYQRSSNDKEYGEKRLQGKWSWGIGGHIEPHDTPDKNPIRKSMLRELQEEIEISEAITGTKVLGYINDDTNDVGQVHFGILYLVETNAELITPKDPEVAIGRLMTLGELEKISSSPDCTVETWSQIALQPLKEYLQSLK